MQHGVDAKHILEESVSLETVGNAYFTRVMHTDIQGLRNLCVVNNRWHMPRTRAVFSHVFAVPPDNKYKLTFIQVEDGLEKDVCASSNP